MADMTFEELQADARYVGLELKYYHLGGYALHFSPSLSEVPILCKTLDDARAEIGARMRRGDVPLGAQRNP